MAKGGRDRFAGVETMRRLAAEGALGFVSDDGCRLAPDGTEHRGRIELEEGAPLFADAAAGEPIGKVTSGGFGPTLNAPVAMGYLPTSHAANGTTIFAEVRGQRLPLKVAPMPFVPNTYKR